MQLCTKHVSVATMVCQQLTQVDNCVVCHIHDVLPYVSVEDSAMSQTYCLTSTQKFNYLHVKCMFTCIRNLIRVREMQVYLHMVKYNTRVLEHM